MLAFSALNRISGPLSFKPIASGVYSCHCVVHPCSAILGLIFGFSYRVFRIVISGYINIYIAKIVGFEINFT